MVLTFNTITIVSLSYTYIVQRHLTFKKVTSFLYLNFKILVFIFILILYVTQYGKTLGFYRKVLYIFEYLFSFIENIKSV